ncbi:MAG: family 43 glycosylhydrolase [Bacteroidales bacterium]|nr:family 43 glycosylhydrolase [Bacteroidales bacterium]
MYSPCDSAGVCVYVSDNLKDWYVPDGKSEWPVMMAEYAPEVCDSLCAFENDGRYYLSYVAGGRRFNAFSRSPLGPFFPDTAACVTWRPSDFKLRRSARMGRDCGFYTNPVYKPTSPDPTVQEGPDGAFYLSSTESRGKVTVKRSTNLVDWEYWSDIFNGGNRPSFVDGGNVWAPDISRNGDSYVTYYSMSTWGGEWAAGIGRAVATEIDGVWTDLGKLFISTEIGVQNSIDPFFIDDGGKKYLFWGSFHGIFCIELDGNGTDIAKDALPVQVAGTAYEGTYILKRDGYYYLFASTGSCCAGMRSTYQTVVGRSENLLGPYLDRDGRPMLENNHEVVITGSAAFAGPGHNSEIVTDDKGESWILYHSYWWLDPKGGRKLMLDKVGWTSDGWPFLPGGGEPSIVARKPYFK